MAALDCSVVQFNPNKTANNKTGEHNACELPGALVSLFDQYDLFIFFTSDWFAVCLFWVLQNALSWHISYKRTSVAQVSAGLIQENPMRPFDPNHGLVLHSKNIRITWGREKVGKDLILSVVTTLF